MVRQVVQLGLIKILFHLDEPVMYQSRRAYENNENEVSPQLNELDMLKHDQVQAWGPDDSQVMRR